MGLDLLTLLSPLPQRRQAHSKRKKSRCASSPDPLLQWRLSLIADEDPSQPLYPTRSSLLLQQRSDRRRPLSVNTSNEITCFTSNGSRVGSSSNIVSNEKGRKCGIYLSWDECREQVDEFSNAVYRKFSKYEDAMAFWNEQPNTSHPGQWAHDMVTFRGQRQNLGGSVHVGESSDQGAMIHEEREGSNAKRHDVRESFSERKPLEPTNGESRMGLLNTSFICGFATGVVATIVVESFIIIVGFLAYLVAK